MQSNIFISEQLTLLASGKNTPLPEREIRKNHTVYYSCSTDAKKFKKKLL